MRILSLPQSHRYKRIYGILEKNFRGLLPSFSKALLQIIDAIGSGRDG
jgi:hypothetical protein